MISELFLLLLPESIFILVLSLYFLKIKNNLFKNTIIVIISTIMSYILYNYVFLLYFAISRFVFGFIISIIINKIYNIKNFKKVFILNLISLIIMLSLEVLMFIPLVFGLNLQIPLDISSNLTLFIISLPTRFSELLILIILFQRRKIKNEI